MMDLGVMARNAHPYVFRSLRKCILIIRKETKAAGKMTNMELGKALVTAALKDRGERLWWSAAWSWPSVVPRKCHRQQFLEEKIKMATTTWVYMTERLRTL